MKKFLSLVVAALLSVSAISTASAAKFTDVDANNEALTDAVELLTALNVTKGTSETEFGTAQNVTREQMAAFIYRMMKAGKSVEGGTNTTSFTDLEDPTFFFMVSWANSQGIIKGRSATSFDPKGGITLQDAYTMIVRALGYDDGTLAYPIGYISKAEDLGLDENLPSTLNYTDTLTRGDVAIILANMFYAETAEVEIKYEASYKFVCPVHSNTDDCDGSGSCNPQAVSNGQVPKEYQKTVAEAIFEVEKISQTVVATPSYSFENFEKPEEDVEMITLSKDYVIDYEDYDTDIDSLGQIEFSELGLEGKADDYFLSDIVMFVKEVDGEYEVFGATAQGTKTTVAFDKVEFGTVSGTSVEKYYDDEEKEYKKINGKVTLDGVVTYLFDAPYSFAKDKDTNKYNVQFITLDSFDGDVEEGDLFVNYVIDDSMDIDETIVGWDCEDEDANVWVKNYDAYLAQVYYGGLGEIDVYDCNGDGKPEYLFVKNFVVGTIDDTEDEDATTIDADPALDAEELIITTDLAIVEGVEFKDEDIVLAYVNPDANYVKVAEVLAGTEATIASAASKYFTLSEGQKIYYQDMKAVVANGVANLVAIDEDMDNVDFDAEATYYFSANGKLVYVAGLNTAINLNDNYVVVLEEEAYLTTAMVDGKLEKAYYIDIYNDGEIKSVKAKMITDETNVYDEDLTPATGEDYDFSDYVDKLATGKSDKKGAYYFELVDFSINNDMTALHDRDEESNEYREMVSGTTKFAQKSGTLYTLEAAEEADNSKLRGVYVKDYTQIIIRHLDKEGEEVVSLFGADNLPDIKEGTRFGKVSYVLVNNTNSTSYENLAVFYGVCLDAEGEIGKLEPSKGKVADVRVIKTYTKASSEDGTVYTYDVFDPFTGTVVSGIEGSESEGQTGFSKGNIVGLTTEGFIDDGVAKAGDAFTAGTFYDTDDDFEDLDNLGWLAVAEFDESTGYLEVGKRAEENDEIIVTDVVDAIFQITDETVVSFADKSEETIKVVGADILNTTSKNYKQGEDKNEPIRVFLCVEVDDDADVEDETFYLVKFAMIVRD